MNAAVGHAILGSVFVCAYVTDGMHSISFDFPGDVGVGLPGC
jgi:hypothetical protein